MNPIICQRCRSLNISIIIRSIGEGEENYGYYIRCYDCFYSVRDFTLNPQE